MRFGPRAHTAGLDQARQMPAAVLLPASLCRLSPDPENGADEWLFPVLADSQRALTRVLLGCIPCGPCDPSIALASAR